MYFAAINCSIVMNCSHLHHVKAATTFPQLAFMAQMVNTQCQCLCLTVRAAVVKEPHVRPVIDYKSFIVGQHAVDELIFLRNFLDACTFE